MIINETYPATPNDFAKGAPEVNIPLQMDPKYRNIGASKKIVRRRVTIKSTNTTGPTKFYSFRAFMTKESVEPEAIKVPLKNIQNILERDDLSELPQDMIGEIKKQMRKGVNPGKKELEQWQQMHGGTEMPQWKNALELIDTAYHVLNMKKPNVGTKAWKQYTDLIPYAVHLMSQKYGISGPSATWRVSHPLVVERMDRDGLLSQLTPLEKKDKENKLPQKPTDDLSPPPGYEPSHVGTKRFFVSIPGAGQTEIDAKNIDEIIESMANKMRRHGVKVRIDQRSEDGAVISFWHQDVKREKITIRQVG
jgi:hypothetical protein